MNRWRILRGERFHYLHVWEFKRYLHGVGDAGTLRILFRSGTHGLNGAKQA